jgi:hypothetical protein
MLGPKSAGDVIAGPDLAIHLDAKEMAPGSSPQVTIFGVGAPEGEPRALQNTRPLRLNT